MSLSDGLRAAKPPSKANPRSRAKKVWRDPHDWYCEDAEPVESLFDHRRFIGVVADPCCGRGNIPEVARTRGHAIFASDIVDRGYEHFLGAGSFLDPGFSQFYDGIENIIFNPPYSYRRGICEAFIRRALKLATGTVCALVPTDYLHSILRHRLFAAEFPPTQIAFLSKRPSMPPGVMIAALGKRAFKGGKKNYCWIIWDRINPAPLPPVWLPPRGAA